MKKYSTASAIKSFALKDAAGEFICEINGRLICHTEKARKKPLMHDIKSESARLVQTGRSPAGRARKVSLVKRNTARSFVF